MNKQEVFNKVVSELRKQGRAARNYDGDCKYRTKPELEPELRCALGVLVKDEFYDKRMEGDSLSGIGSETQKELLHRFKTRSNPGEFGKKVLILEILEKSGIEVETTEDIEFLGDLQLTHDTVLPEHWECGWKRIAVKWNLSVPK